MIDHQTLPETRWIGVIFLQGDEAAAVLDLIEQRGAPAAVEYLQQFDLGDATTDAALVNGYVYGRIPAGSTDQTLEDPDALYALTYSESFEYVSLLRRHPFEEDVAPLNGGRARHVTHDRHTARDPDDVWAGTSTRSTQQAARSVTR